MSYEPFEPVDSTFLHVETASATCTSARSHLEGPAPRYADLLQMIPASAPRPALPPGDPHCALRPRPAGVGRRSPLNIEYHVRQTALGSPGGEEELRRLVGRLMSQQLDGPSRSGRSGSSRASRTITGARLEDPPRHGRRVREPSCSRGLRHRARRRAPPCAAVAPVRTASSVSLATTRWPTRSAVPMSNSVPCGIVAVLAPGPLPGSRPSQGLLHPRRDVATTRSRASTGRSATPRTPGDELGEEVRTIRHGLGGSFNDVVLAAITGAFRDLLLSRGESVDRSVRTLVPVSVRTRDAAVEPSATAPWPIGFRPCSPTCRSGSRTRRAPRRGHRPDGPPQVLPRGKSAAQALTSLGGFAPQRCSPWAPGWPARPRSATSTP